MKGDSRLAPAGGFGGDGRVRSFHITSHHDPTLLILAVQELLAPHDLVFYSATWAEIGTRKSLASEVSSVTRVSKKILQHGFDPNDTVLVAEIMSWAKGRKTTRIEDVAYSLLGLFDVYMPMLYGEGARAFIRLQEEILKHSEDQSIFAWEGVNLHKPGLLSPSPEFFSDCPPRQSTSTRFSRRKSPSVTSEGILVDLRLIPFAPNIYLAVLNYDFADHAFKNESFQHGIFLRALDRDNRFVRVRYSGKDLWTGYAFAHKSEAGARLWMDSPTPGRIRKLTAVHRLSDTELMAVNKDPTSIYRVHVDPKFQPDGKFFRHARAGCQGTHRHPEFPIEAGTYGHVGEFAPGGSSNSGCVRGIILGFDFDFSTICMLSLSIYCDNQSYRDRLDFFLSSDINWTPVNDRTINGLQEEASARNVPVCVYSVRNGPIWTTEGGSDVLLLKISNKFGMSDDVVINIDARTADQRGKKGSKGIFSLKISGCCPTDIEVVPFKSDIKHGESRRASSSRDWDEEVECSSEGEDWSRSEVDIGNNDYLRPSRAERALPLRNKQR